MKADKTFSGVTPDYGTILRVNTRVTSESTAALMEQLSIYDSAYLGGHLRPVRRAVFIDRPMFGMSMMANNIPAVDIALRNAVQAFKPYDALGELDTILDQLGGSSRAPAVTVIPCTTLLANGYKFADTLIQSQNAWYQDRASWLVGGDQPGRNQCHPVTNIAIAAGPGLAAFQGPALPVNAPYVALGHVTVEGQPTRPLEEAEPYADGSVILLPVLGQGPAPFLAAGRRWRKDGTSVPADEVDRSMAAARDPYHVRYQYADVIPLRWAIFYQEQDAEIDSPIKKVVMIAFLNHLLDYLDGCNLQPGQYQWPVWANGANPSLNSGQASAPYSPTMHGATGHDLINDVLAETVRAAALRLEYKTAEELPGSTEMQLIRAVANLLYFLDHRDLLIRALINTSSMRQFFTILLESELLHNGATMQTVRRIPGTGEVVIGTDFQEGVAPRESCDWLWDRVMTMLPTDAFDVIVTDALGHFFSKVRHLAPFTPQNQTAGKTAYNRMVKTGFIDENDPDLTQMLAAQATAYGRLQIKRLAKDMRADYVAAAVLNRWRESLPLIIALFKGEVEGFEHLHVNTPNAALSMEVTVNILESIQLMLDRDLLSSKDVLEWEEPYSGAHFSTAWQAYSVRFPTYPIEYVIHNLAVDYLRELTLPQHMNNQATITAVTNAFQQVGVTLIQCEPAMTYLPLARSGTTRNAVYRTYMRGELQACGRTIPGGVVELSGDVSPSHGALRVTSTYYVRSSTIWNQMLEMPRQVVARSYNPQPTPIGWHDFMRMLVTQEQLRTVLRNASRDLVAGLWPENAVRDTQWGFTHWVDPNPAFRDVACVLPYVQMMVQTPPEAYNFTMYSRVTFESDQKICNLSGTPIVPEMYVPINGVDQWAMPNLATQMAYQANPMTHMILPLSWNAVR